MRPALRSIAIQAAGSAATVAAALLVARGLGLAAQGEFGLLRSWSDAALTLVVLGLPQALLHLQYRLQVPVAALRPWVARYAGAWVAVVAVAGLAAWLVWPPEGRAVWRTPVLVAAAAVPFAAGHLLWRALALRELGVVRYAWLTVAPAMLMLVALLPVVFAGWRAGLAWVLLVAAASSAILSWALVRRALRRLPPDRADSGVPWSRRTLWAIGTETGGQNVLAALTPALVLSTAGALGSSLAEIGVVALGLQVYQLFGVAAAYVAPMVYDRAARAEPPMQGRELLALMRANATPRTLLAFGALALLAVGALPWLWPAGTATPLLVLAMAVAGAVSMAGRLLITLLQARGAFRVLTLNALGRLVLAVGLTAALLRIEPARVAVPLALVVTEVASLLWLVRLMPGAGMRRA
jgi:hypothetical protein